jgi:hypothetical protein
MSESLRLRPSRLGTRLFLAPALLGALVVACGGGDSTSPSNGTDGGDDGSAETDSGTSDQTDGAVGPDATVDSGTGTDAAEDAKTPVVDATSDSSQTEETGSSQEAGADAAVDAGAVDAAVEAGSTDAATDDGAVDAATEAGVEDAGAEAGPTDAAPEAATPPACSPNCPDGNACNVGEDCASAVCTNGTCAPPSCAPGCTNGNLCGAPTDCASGVCTNGLCAVPSCAPTCPVGVVCGAPTDCASGVCTNGTCAAPACAPSCANASGCGANGDCASGVCTNGLCAPPSCAPNCGGGNVCGAGTDCASGTCTGNFCTAPTCFLGGIGATCTANWQCQTESCSGGTCQALGALSLVEVDDPYVVADAFNDGTIYTYIAFGPRGGTPTIVGGTDVAFVEHGGGGINQDSSYQITSSTPITSITVSTATQSTFTVHLGSLFWDGIFDPSPANATHTIPAGQSVAWGYGFTEDLGASNWYASVDGNVTSYATNVRVHSFSAPIAPGATHAVMAAGYASGPLGIQASYWGYSDDNVSCP